MSPKDSKAAAYWLQSILDDRAESAPPPAIMETTMADDSHTSGRRPAIHLLVVDRWDEAFGWLYTATERELLHRGKEMPTGMMDCHERSETRTQIMKLVDVLYAMSSPETGNLALAWLMMTVDTQHPESFDAVMPQLQYALDHDCPASGNASELLRLHELIAIWWRAAAGEWIDSEVSIFRIADDETRESAVRDVMDPDFAPLPEHKPVAPPRNPWKRTAPAGPTLVVMPSSKATKLNSFQAAFKPIIDKPLPLVVAGDVAHIRSTLLRDLRVGQPVTLKPMILVGSPGCGKSRLVRRLADLTRSSLYRYDGSAAGDNHFGGTSKAWSNTEPSVPARAIAQSVTANPIVMIDEIEKASDRTSNGNLWMALMPFLERETSARYRDQSLDAELDLSRVSFVATANSIEKLPAPLKDRFRIVRVPSPTLAHLPALAAQVMMDLARDDESRSHDAPLADDELAVIGRAWMRAGFSVRKLQKIVSATLEARDQYAMRH